jgi:hypothetical protein
MARRAVRSRVVISRCIEFENIRCARVLDKAAIKNKYPHTVGFFLKSSGKEKTWKSDYLRTKKVRSKRGFHNFLKELSLSEYISS